MVTDPARDSGGTDPPADGGGTGAQGHDREERLAADGGDPSADGDGVSRRGLLRGSVALGLGVVSSGETTLPSRSAMGDGTHGATTYHDHGGDSLGAAEPLQSVAATVAHFDRVNGVHCPRPGDVQAALDAAGEATGHSRVRLRPETSYDPADTWEIPDGTTLDYNGAHVDLTTDVTVHDVHPAGRVEQPVVDLRGVTGGFSSSVFVFSSRRHGFYGESRIWRVRGGITRGDTTGGTVFEFDQGSENAIYFVHCDHTVRNVSTVVDMHREDAFGINGNRIFGLWYGFERGIHMHNVQSPERKPDNMSGNGFDVIAQPQNDTEILWDMEVGHHNILRGRLWDYAMYDDVMWRIHEPPAGGDKHVGNVLHWHPIGGSESYIFDGTNLAGTFDDRHGDPRNRVVVPWLQGRPVSDVGGDS